MRDLARSSWLARVAVLCLVGVVVADVISTARVMSQTYDEPIHISTGLEWLQRGRYTMWTETPPLARVAVALRPYWSGVRLDESTKGAVPAGNAAIYRDGLPQRHLGEARLGTLPFLLLLLLVVWHWTGRARVPEAQFLAVAMVATLPAIVAHSALATTDIASTATFLLSTYAFLRWIERPTWPAAIAMAAAFGIASATKFSVVMFAVPVAIAVAVVRWFADGVATATVNRSVIVKQIAMGLAIVALVMWASYRFSTGTIAELPWVSGSHVSASDGRLFAIVNRIEHTRLPAPELPHGLLALADHDSLGQNAYALGKVSRTGFWFFYPLALAVKTPLTFLLFGLLAGLAVVSRRRMEWSAVAAAAAAVAVLAGALTGRVNLGLRHVLVIYPLIAIAASMAAAVWLRSPSFRVRTIVRLALTAMLAAQAFILWRAHPDALAYFNVFAGSDPARVLVDSDLDWGQDLNRLRTLAQQRGIEELQIAYFGTARLCEPGMPRLHWLPPGQPAIGWIAVSENYYRGVWRIGRRDVCDMANGWERPRQQGDYSWLRSRTPVAFAGKSIRLYYVPAGE